MKYFELQISETTPEHLANWLYGEVNALPPAGIVLGQPPNQEEVEITQIEFIPSDSIPLGHCNLKVHAQTLKVGPAFKVGEATRRLGLGIGRRLEPVISIELHETGQGKVHLLGECANYMVNYIRYLIDRMKEYYQAHELKPAAAKREDSLTWIQVSSDMPSFDQIKPTTSETRRAVLIEEYKAANTQLSSALSEVDRVRLKRQVEALEKEIAQIENELGLLQGQAAEE